MKKYVVKLEFDDENIHQKAMGKVCGLSGLDSIALDPKDKKMTVTGSIDPVVVVEKLRKLCYADLVSVGPATEIENDRIGPYWQPLAVAPPPYYNWSLEEDPNGCVIC